MSEKQTSQTRHARTIVKDLFASERSFPLLSATILFLLWLIFFIVSPLFSNANTCFAADEISACSVFRDKLLHAEFSSYSFASGLGISLPRLALTGFGGLLTIPSGLLPETVFPQAVLVLSAFRLGLAAYCFSKLLSVLLKKNTLSLVLLFSLLYTGLTFSLSYFLHLPVSSAYAMLPLALYLAGKTVRQSRPVISFSLLLSLFLYLTSNVILALLLFPILIGGLVYFARKSKDNSLSRTCLRLSVHVLLSIGLSGIILIPQLMQIPYVLKDQAPASSFLQTIGSDTPSDKTEISFSSPITELLFGNNGSLVLVGQNAGAFSVDGSYSDHFDLLNEWIYSLWPYLPSIPFQTSTMATTTPEFTDTQHARFSVSTLFSDPLYAAIKLPHLSHPVDVRLNGNSVGTISYSRKSVLIRLGTFNAGQILSLELVSTTPEDLEEVQVSFGYLNTFDWSRYTESANFGVIDRSLSHDGLSANILPASDSLILTNIPYEKGWTVYLNGVRSTVTSYEGALLAAPVSAGNYYVFFRYQAPGSTIGSLLSALSCLALAAYSFFGSSPKRSSIKSQKIESK